MTDDFVIPEEAVDAAARACHESDFAWSSDGIHDEYWRKMASAALEAALPHLRAHQVREVEANRERVADVLRAARGRTNIGHLVHGFDAACPVCQGSPFGIALELEAAGLLPTEAETKALAETATKLGYELGRKEAAEAIATAIEHRRANTAHRIPWEAFTDAAKVARDFFTEPKPKRDRREPCDTHCPCICHDGWGGAHPNRDCRDAARDITKGAPNDLR